MIEAIIFEARSIDHGEEVVRILFLKDIDLDSLYNLRNSVEEAILSKIEF